MTFALFKELKLRTLIYTIKVAEYSCKLCEVLDIIIGDLICYYADILQEENG